MIDLPDLGVWTAGAVIIVGIVQWLKNVFPRLPSWVWQALVPVLALCAALSRDGFTVWNALGMVAVSQTFYEVIVKAVINRSAGPAEVYPPKGP